MNVKLPLPSFHKEPNTEYFLHLTAYTRTATPLIPARHTVSAAQWLLPGARISEETPVQGVLTCQDLDEKVVFQMAGISLSFSKTNGELVSYVTGDKEFLIEGLRPNFWRPMTDNDVANKTGERCAIWNEAGERLILQDFEYTLSSDRQKAMVSASYAMPEQMFICRVTYTVYADGVIKVNFVFEPGEYPLPEMPRLGMYMILKEEFENMTWFGRGPHENYWDRKNSALVDLYSASVWEQYHPYVRAQETANKTDVRWAALQNDKGVGLLIRTTDEPLSVSAWNFPMKALKYIPSGTKRVHGGSIQKQPMVWINIDSRQMGVGDDTT